MGRLLAWHVADPNLIPVTPYSPQSSIGVIPITEPGIGSMLCSVWSKYKNKDLWRLKCLILHDLEDEKIEKTGNVRQSPGIQLMPQYELVVSDSPPDSM